LLLVDIYGKQPNHTRQLDKNATLKNKDRQDRKGANLGLTHSGVYLFANVHVCIVTQMNLKKKKKEYI
jgi:hypothetical protein